MFERWLRDGSDLVAADHTAKVVPAGSDDLPNMHNEESDEAHRQPKMFPPRHFIAAENRGEPVGLGWFVNRKAREEHAESHDSGCGN